VPCSANGPCRHCQKFGHWSGECPLGWFNAGTTLPGYSDRGKRFIDEWDTAYNPRKATAQAWVTFVLQCSKTFLVGASRL
jgi:hypothetical protein